MINNNLIREVNPNEFASLTKNRQPKPINGDLLLLVIDPWLECSCVLIKNAVVTTYPDCEYFTSDSYVPFMVGDADGEHYYVLPDEPVQFYFGPWDPDKISKALEDDEYIDVGRDQIQAFLDRCATAFDVASIPNIAVVMTM